MNFYSKNDVFVGSQDVQQRKANESIINSNFGKGVQSKILQPTLSIQQKHDRKSVAERSFINSIVPVSFKGTNRIKNERKTLEHEMILSEADADLLKRCLKVTRSSIITFEEFNEQFFNAYGKHYQDEFDINPITHYEYDSVKREFKVDRMK